MSSNALSSRLGRLPLTDQAREKLLRAFQMTARSQGLSPAVTDRYQAWALVFLSWCFDSPPRPVGPDQIEDFRKALLRAETDEERICEAMDALAFLFGAVGASEVLSSESPHSDAAQTVKLPVPVCGDASDQEAIRTLRIGWQAETGEHVDAESRVERCSMAETYLEHYQAQIRALHGAASEEQPDR